MSYSESNQHFLNHFRLKSLEDYTRKNFIHKNRDT